MNFSDLLEDDGKCPPPKVPDRLQWEKTTVYLPFTSSSSESGAKGVCHTHKSLLSWIYSPENAANHYLDQVRASHSNLFILQTKMYKISDVRRLTRLRKLVLSHDRLLHRGPVCGLRHLRLLPLRVLRRRLSRHHHRQQALHGRTVPMAGARAEK